MLEGERPQQLSGRGGGGEVRHHPPVQLDHPPGLDRGGGREHGCLASPQAAATTGKARRVDGGAIGTP